MNKQILVLAFAILLLCPFALGKSYTLKSADVNYDILSDGRVLVKQTIAYDFDGSFSFAYLDIPKGSWQIKDIVAYDISGPRKKLVVDTKGEGAYERITWYYSANSEPKDFEISYTLIGAITKYDDVAEFYWKVWGDEWDHALGDLLVSVNLPGKVAPDNLYTWRHIEGGRYADAKWGLEKDNLTYLFEVLGVQSNTYVELRLAFPSELITGEHAIQKSGSGLDMIESQEEGFERIDELNAEIFSVMLFLLPGAFILLFVGIALTLLGKDDSAIVIRIAAIVLVASFVVFISTLFQTDFALTAVFVVIEIALFVICNRLFVPRWKTENKDIFEREIPGDYGPATLGVLLSGWGRAPNVKCMAADVLDICTRGKMKIEKTGKGKKDYKLNIINESGAGLSPSEKVLFREIKNASKFGWEKKGFFSTTKKIASSNPKSLTLKEWEKWLKNDQSNAQSFFNNWKDGASKYAKALELIPKSFNKAIALFIGISIALILLGILVSPSSVFAMAGTAIAMILLFPNALVTETKKGAEDKTRWLRLRKFLKEASNIKNMNADAVILWEKYLVYSIPLGVADKVERTMGTAFKEYGENQTYPGVIFAGSAASFASSSSFSTAISGFSTSFASTTATAGGAGVSGAGGAGGGGGGGGAG